MPVTRWLLARHISFSVGMVQVGWGFFWGGCADARGMVWVVVMCPVAV